MANYTNEQTAVIRASVHTMVLSVERNMTALREAIEASRFIDAERAARRAAATLEVLIASCEAVDPAILGDGRREALLAQGREIAAEIVLLRGSLN